MHVVFQAEGTFHEILGIQFKQPDVRLKLKRMKDCPVRMIVTTQVADVQRELARQDASGLTRYASPCLKFTWNAHGTLERVSRQFRLDLLRHIGTEELNSRVLVGIYTDVHQGNIEPAEPGTSHVALPTPQSSTSTAASTAVQATEEPHNVRRPESLPGNLYLNYYGFERMPFNNTPDTFFYFPSPKHQEALSRLVYAISERKGFVMVSGEIGSGKSTLCRALLAQLPGECRTALITHTHLDATQLIRAIADDLNLATVGKNDREVLQVLYDYLIEQLTEGCTVVIIIDEAQNLPTEALEAIRMISNLETEQEKLIQLLLLGQPELRERMKHPDLEQLRQRLAVQFHLEPLSRAETATYIEHRLTRANPAEPIHFPRRARCEVYRYSGGVPRLINTICDNALLTAFTQQRRRITPGLIREAAGDLDLEPRHPALADFFRLW